MVKACVRIASGVRSVWTDSPAAAARQVEKKHKNPSPSLTHSFLSLLARACGLCHPNQSKFASCVCVLCCKSKAPRSNKFRTDAHALRNPHSH